MKTFKQFANEVSDAVLKKKEEIFKSMKKKRSEFVARYGDDAENVMHATAMDRAKSSSIKENMSMDSKDINFLNSFLFELDGISPVETFDTPAFAAALDTAFGKASKGFSKRDIGTIWKGMKAGKLTRQLMKAGMGKKTVSDFIALEKMLVVGKLLDLKDAFTQNKKGTVPSLK